MARPTGGGGTRRTRVSQPSAQELLNTLATNMFGEEFKGVSVTATKAEFSAMSNAWLENDTSMDYYDPKKYSNWAGEDYVNDKGYAPGRTTYEIIDTRFNLDDEKNWRIPGDQPDEMEDTSPAEFSLVPTSTSNPQRPRTVAAGYDEYEEKLTVMFRDGTIYNYYEVTPSEWNKFKANRSKGAVIHSLLDFKPRGYADQSSMSKQAREAFYRFSRGIQTVKGGKATGQTKTTYKTNAQANRSRKK